jgi:hypothetical protein
VRAHRGHLVWSRPNARGRFDLVLWHAGAIRRLPVPSRRVPFDADIGPGPNGGLVVVYSRCRREPRERHHLTRLPLYEQGRDCSLFRHRVGLRGERRLKGLSAPAGSETLPAVWRDRVAFARHGRVIRARADGAGAVPLRRGRPSSEGEQPALPQAVEIRRARVAFEWRAWLTRCPGRPFTDFPGELTQIVSGSRVLATGCDTDLPSGVAAPSVGRAGVSYVERRRGVRLRTPGRTPVELDPRTLSAQRDGGLIVTCAALDEGGFEIAVRATGGRAHR